VSRFFYSFVVLLVFVFNVHTASAQEASANLTPGADLSGVWTRDNSAGATSHNSSWSREIPNMTEWAQAQFDGHMPTFGERAVSVSDTNDPVYACYPPGTPRIWLHPFPWEIIQMPGRVLMIYEYDGFIRNIFTDGRGHREGIGNSWMGDSIGYWDDDVLVVETTNMRDDTWIDREGVPHSEEMVVIERFHLRDDNSLWIDIEITDPVALNEPWVTSQAHRKTDWTLEEFRCMDNVSFSEWEEQILEYDN
jgi:hypothetical protein